MNRDTVDMIEKLTNTSYLSGSIKDECEVIDVCKALEDLVTDSKFEGEIASKREDLLEILMVHGYVPEALLKRIDTENNLAVLKRWFKISIHTDSIEDFEAQMDEENVMD